MANKKISELTSYTSPVSGDVLPINDTTNTTTKKVTVDNLLNVLSSLFRIKDPTDTTKKVAFDVSGVTTATTRTITVPDADLTMVGTSTTQTLTNKTLTSPTINLGSDAEGDTYYRNSSGAFVRLPRGTDNYILKMNGNVPNWEAETVTVDASTTVKGIVEVATSSEVTAGTATGGTGAVLVVTPDALASSSPTFNATNLTNIIRIASASDNLKTSYDTTHTATSMSEIAPNKIQVLITGTFRFKFDGKAGYAASFSFQIYKNGVAVGTSRSTSDNISYTTWSEDITGAPGDIFSIIMGAPGSPYGSVRNFRCYYDISTPSTYSQTA